MGNSSEKIKSNGLHLQEFIPPTRQRKSPIINNMIMRVVRKIEEEKYFSVNDSYAPNYVFYDSEPQATLPDRGRASCPGIKKLHSLNQEIYHSPDKSRGSYTDRNEFNSRDSARGIQQATTEKSILKSGSKENKNGYSVNRSSTRDRDIDPMGTVKAPRGVEARNQQYFLSQNKLNTIKAVKKPPTHQSLKEGYAKPPLQVNTNIEYFSLSQPQQNKSNNMQSVLSPSNVADDDEGINVGSDLQKLPKKKKLYVNCNLERKLFSLPTKIQFRIILFLIDEYVNMVLVSPMWYYKVNELFENQLLNVDNSFIKTHMNFITFKSSYFSIAPYHFSNRVGFRMDRNIIGEVLPPLVGKTVVISFSYRLYKRKDAQYKATYKFDVVKKGARRIWIQKEESKINFDDTRSAFVQPIMPVCVNDNIKFALNFYNLGGLVDISSIRWKDPVIETIQSIPRGLSCEAIKCMDKNRICEVEDINSEWIPYNYFESQNKIQYDMFDPQLALQDTKCAGVDVIILKSQYLANYAGEVKRAPQKLGINIFIVDSKSEVLTEVKRTGLSHDLENFIQLRVGDKLTLYLTKG